MESIRPGRGGGTGDAFFAEDLVGGAVGAEELRDGRDLKDGRDDFRTMLDSAGIETSDFPANSRFFGSSLGPLGLF